MDADTFQKMDWCMLYLKDVDYCPMCLKLNIFHVLIIENHGMDEYQSKGLIKIDHEMVVMLDVNDLECCLNEYILYLLTDGNESLYYVLFSFSCCLNGHKLRRI